MIEEFANFLIEMGYEPFKRLFNKKKIEWYNIPLGKINTVYFRSNFNVIQPGGIDIRFVKDGSEIILGLNEKGHPPTLISPRPRINMKKMVAEWNGMTFPKEDNYPRVEEFSEVFDDAMNEVLKMKTPQEIFEAMYNKEICFEIDLTNTIKYNKL